MPLTNFSIKDGIDQSIERIKNPFDRYFATAPDLKGASERNDFKKGFEILEFQRGKPLEDDKITLIGDQMPHQPFTFGGSQQLVKDYYPGNSEPTVQVLGAREDDVTIRGRFKAKLFKSGTDKDRREALRLFATALQEQLDAIRIRGNLVRITMGEWQRFGFIEKTKFDMKTLADIDYEINFMIVGFNPPSDIKTISRTKVIPFDKNKELIAFVAQWEQTSRSVPDSYPKSLAEQLNEAISDVAGAINLVTSFIDNVLNEVDNVKASIARAQGLIQFAKNKLVEYQTRIGGYPPDAGAPTGVGIGISQAYLNTMHTHTTLAGAFSLMDFLSFLSEDLKKIAQTEALARHRIQSGDTLQRIAVKYYNDSQQWEEIYEHNKLNTTDLESIVGQVIEIPRIS